MARTDPHSYFDDAQPRTRHLGLELEVDFEGRGLDGWALLDLGEPSSGPLDLDTKGLDVHSVESEDGTEIPFELADEEPILGRRLRLDLPPGTRRVTIEYSSAIEALGLQWLDPAQTEGKRHPFLFSHFQPIHARTCMPVQDSPRARVTYRAAITVPKDLTAVMSAGSVGEQPGDRAGTRTFLFDMPQSIPTYLIALAVGDLSSHDISPRSRVWAEPATLDAAAHEFAEIEEMITTAEELFGPYEWDRYDMIVLPPSFPYGGMENPRLTFLTPTLLAGDRSLVDVVAHELAHSWTGNLVTNASVDHFWLNEGATVWAERRIVEALRGRDAAVLAWAIGEQALAAEFERFGAKAAVTRLRNDLEGTDPDDVYSSIPYEKGSRFLALLEQTAGRERFDAFIRRYIEKFRFTSITTEEFLEFVEQELPGLAEKVDAQAWLYEPGMPQNAPVFRSGQLEALTALARGFSAHPGADRGLVARRDARLSATPPPDPRPRRLRLAGRRDGSHLPRQLRDPRGVADDRCGVRLRAGLSPSGRGASPCRSHEVPASALQGDGRQPTDSRAGPKDLRRGLPRLSRSVPPRLRSSDGAVR